MSETTEYIRACPQCLCEYDAMQAAWCSCDPHPSKLCPFCLTCLCQTPGECEMFWAEAPECLLQEGERLRNCRLRLGDMLVRAGLLTEEEMARGLQHQQASGGRFGEALLALGILDARTIQEFVQMQDKVSTFDLSRVHPDLHLARRLGVEFCRAKRILPLEKESFQGRTLLTLVMADPSDQDTLDQVQLTAGCHVLPGRAPEQEILAVLETLLPHATV